MEDLSFSSGNVTISAWVKRDGAQSEWAGILFNRSSGGAGFNFGTANELRYHWNSSNYSWDSGLVPPDGQWVFVALVIEPSKATVYMYDGTLQSSVHTSSHTAQIFGGTTYIGWDPNASTRHFKGNIDDVRIYTKSFSQAEILDLIAGGGADCLRPFDGATHVATSASLQWTSGGRRRQLRCLCGNRL